MIISSLKIGKANVSSACAFTYLNMFIIHAFRSIQFQYNVVFFIPSLPFLFTLLMFDTLR
jgi:hypothetical protein